jgi:hypothetical protein
MSHLDSFCDRLNTFMVEKDRFPKALAKLSKVPQRTIENWRACNATPTRPGSLISLLKVAAAFPLTEQETNGLLTAANQASIVKLREIAERSNDQALIEVLSLWSKTASLHIRAAQPIANAWSAGMDFIDWSGVVLHKLIEAGQADEHIRQFGMRVWEWAQRLFSTEQMQQPDFHGSPAHRGFLDAVDALEQIGLVQSSTGGSLYKVTMLGQARAKDMNLLWMEVCTIDLDTQQRELLQFVNRTAMLIGSNYAQLIEVTQDDVLPVFGWTDGLNHLVMIARELKQLHLVKAIIGAGFIRLRPTYNGLVWEIRRE